MAKKRKKRSRRGKLRLTRQKVCRFCEDRIFYIDFKDQDILRRYTTEQGKILPRRITGTCFTHQKMLSKAVKRARNIALI